jgi:hypothetical protein
MVAACIRDFISWRDDFAALGSVVGEGDIETVRGPFIQRFYRGGCADVCLLGSCLTLAGCLLMLERSRPHAGGLTHGGQRRTCSA